MTIWKKDNHTPKPRIEATVYGDPLKGYSVFEDIKGYYRLQLDGKTIPTGAMFSNNNGKDVKKLYVAACKALNQALMELKFTGSKTLSLTTSTST